MKRDLNVFRELLLALEAVDHPVMNVEIEGHDRATVDGHLKLMAEAGLVHLEDRSDLRNRKIHASLKLAGHELLAAIRRDDVWQTVRTLAGDMPLELVEELARHELRKQIRTALEEVAVSG